MCAARIRTCTLQHLETPVKSQGMPFVSGRPLSVSLLSLKERKLERVVDTATAHGSAVAQICPNQFVHPVAVHEAAVVFASVRHRLCPRGCFRVCCEPCLETTCTLSRQPARFRRHAEEQSWPVPAARVLDPDNRRSFVDTLRNHGPIRCARKIYEPYGKHVSFKATTFHPDALKFGCMQRWSIRL